MSLNTLPEITSNNEIDWDSTEFNLIYQRLSVLLQKYSLYYVKDEEASRSIVNDLFVKLWFDKKYPENLKGYLFKAVKNSSLNYIASQKRSPLTYLEESDLTLISDVKVNVVYDDLISDKLAFLHKVIELLPERRQLVFKLYRLEGFSYAEIAELMQISVRTVEDHLSKSMQFIHIRAKQLVDTKLTEA